MLRCFKLGLGLKVNFHNSKLGALGKDISVRGILMWYEKQKKKNYFFIFLYLVWIWEKNEFISLFPSNLYNYIYYTNFDRFRINRNFLEYVNSLKKCFSFITLHDLSLNDASGLIKGKWRVSFLWFFILWARSQVRIHYLLG